MGWGDELMAAGQARALYARTGQRVRIVDRHRGTLWHKLWEGLPYVVRPGEAGKFQEILNCAGFRPYHLEKRMDRWVYNPAFRPEPAEIVFTPAELEFAAAHAPGVVIEPNLKPKASPNKHWGHERWEQFVALAGARHLTLTQLGPAGTRVLPGAGFIETPDFRHGCAVLANALAYVGHEGGLHHAAAALGVPGVVIFGGFTPVELTGYAIHRNLGVTFAEACGRRVPCEHCAGEMAKIAPAAVLSELEAVLEKRRRSVPA